MNPNHSIEELPNGKLRVRTVNDMESKTVQSQVAESEIRHILAKYEQTGVLVGLRDVDLAFRDVSEFTDFADLMRQSKETEAAFMQLPSKVREAFDHDHHKWLDAAHDGLSDGQRERLTRLGVLKAVEKAPGGQEEVSTAVERTASSSEPAE